MSGRSDGDITVCRTFCSYYNASKNSDLACRGFIVLQGLMRSGKVGAPERPGRIARPGAGDIDFLKETVCRACEFRDADCDFILTNGAAEPCGGMVMLMHLLGSDELTREEVDRCSAQADDAAYGPSRG